MILRANLSGLLWLSTGYYKIFGGYPGNGVSWGKDGRIGKKNVFFVFNGYKHGSEAQSDMMTKFKAICLKHNPLSSQEFGNL